MDIFVISRSRWLQSDTLNHLGEVASSVTLIVPNAQVRSYRALASQYQCRLLGCPKDGVALTRQFCGKISRANKFLMLDDDLKFYCRISKKDWHLRYPRDIGCSVSSMIQVVSSCLDTYVHVGISSREGNNRLPYEGVECSRPLRALAYRKDEFLQLQHGRVQIMEDFDITMQLLRRGYKNFIIACWAQGQTMTQAPGGCSDYRTHELHDQNVRKFAELHSPFVHLHKKRNKSGGEFGTRTEAIIYWKKAWTSSQSTG
jgi:hypothetical protein